MRKMIVVVAGIVELGCLLGLTGIALKRNNDCYKAECKYINEMRDRYIAEINNICKDAEIKSLKKALEELKAKGEES